MPRKKTPVVSPPEETVPEETLQGPPQGRLLQRPDGFYWESKDTKELRGPFETRGEAEADMLAGGASGEDLESEETLQEAESEIGMSEWIDPDTGGPAEDNVPRIEDH
jgi:hypothetical protein